MSSAGRFYLCLLASAFVNGVIWLLAAQMWQPAALPKRPVLTRIKLITLALPPAAQFVPVVPVRTVVRIPPPTPRKPVLRKPLLQKRLTPGTRVPLHQTAAPARSAGGSAAPAPPQIARLLPPPPAISAAPPIIIATNRAADTLPHTLVPPPNTVSVSTDAASRPALPVVPSDEAAETGQSEEKSTGGSGTADGVGTGKGAGPGMGQAAGEPFGIGQGLAGNGGPRHVVYVLDISGSMTSRIDRAEDELRRALSGLGPQETFNIVVFSDEVRSFDTGMAPATPALKQRADFFLTTLQVGGDTNLDAAMKRALSLPDINDVVLLTDGVPHGSGENNFKKLAWLIRERNKNHARIFTVGLVGKNPDGTDDSFAAAALLRQIAQDSGGASELVTLGTTSP